MSAGNKLDPTAFEVMDISKTSVDPLARVMRRELRKRGIEHLTVVISSGSPGVIPSSSRHQRYMVQWATFSSLAAWVIPTFFMSSMALRLNSSVYLLISFLSQSAVTEQVIQPGCQFNAAIIVCQIVQQAIFRLIRLFNLIHPVEVIWLPVLQNVRIAPELFAG